MKTCDFRLQLANVLIEHLSEDWSVYVCKDEHLNECVIDTITMIPSPDSLANASVSPARLILSMFKTGGLVKSSGRP